MVLVHDQLHRTKSNGDNIMINKKHLISLILITAILLSNFTGLPIVNAQVQFSSVDSLTLYESVNEAKVSTIYGTDLYIGSDEHYGVAKIEKIDLTTFTRTATLQWQVGTSDDIADLIIDGTGSYIYAIEDSPSQPILYKIDTNPLEIVANITFPSDSTKYYCPKGLEIIGTDLYIGTGSIPSSIIKVDLGTFTETAVVNAPVGVRYGGQLHYNGTGDILYLVGNSDLQPPTRTAVRVCRFNITTFTYIDKLDFPNGVAYGHGGFIEGEFLYINTHGYATTRITKVNMTSFSINSTLNFPSNLNTYSMISNGTHGFVNSQSASKYLLRFNLTSMAWEGAGITFPSTAINAFSKSGIYFYSANGGTWTSINKVNMNTFAIDDSLPLYSGTIADDIVALKSDGTYLYSLDQMRSGTSRISKVLLTTFELVTTVALSADDNDAEGFELYNEYLYVGTDNGTGVTIKKVATSDLSIVDTLILGANNYTAQCLHVAGDGYLYAGVDMSGSIGKLYKLDPSNLDIISVMTLESGENDPYAMDSDGTYLYLVIETNSGICQIAKISLATFTRVDSVTLDAVKEYPRSCDYDDGYLYVGCEDYPSVISKIDVATMVEVDFEILPVDEYGGIGVTVFRDYVYVGSENDDGGRVTQLRISTLDRVDAITLNETNKETDVSCLELVTIGYDTFLFAGIYEYSPATIVQIYLSSTSDYDPTGEGIYVAPIYDPDAVNATWYMRSDTHTVQEILGYKLLTTQTTTATDDRRITASTAFTSYGIRVWVLNFNGEVEELTGGVPVATVSRTSDGNGIQSGTWTCPLYPYVIDSVIVRVYQRWDYGFWTQRKTFITKTKLMLKFPENTWTVYYWTNRTVGSTYSTLSHGSSSFNSRITFQYYVLNPFEEMQYHVLTQNPVSFFITPWYYYLGEAMWGLVLLFFCVTTYNWSGSIKVVIGWLWIFGGVGGILSAFIPALVLNIAWIFLALAIAATVVSLVK